MCSQKTIDGIDSGKLIAVNKWGSILNYVSLPALVGALIWAGSWKTDLDNRTFNSSTQRDNYMHQVEGNTEHSHSVDSHMPYDRKVLLFMPRTEIQYKMDVMNEKLDKIMNKLDI